MGRLIVTETELMDMAVRRAWGRVRKTSTCWIWDGLLTTHGYARVTVNRSWRLGHRFFYELLVGPVPEGLVLDHLCRVPVCVNPAHLEPVTRRENTLRGFNPPANQARQKMCIAGHPFDDRNTYVWKSRKRLCRECHRIREAARRKVKSA